jgi:pre-mRNA-processing factor 19
LLSCRLSKGRKNRVIPENLATAEEIKEYSQISTNTLHKTSPAGVTCLNLHPNNQDLVEWVTLVFIVQVITGGLDSQAVLFNRGAGKVVSTLTGHSKALTDVLFHPSQDVIFTTSKDKTAKLWTPAEKGSWL